MKVPHIKTEIPESRLNNWPLISEDPFTKRLAAAIDRMEEIPELVPGSKPNFHGAEQLNQGDINSNKPKSSMSGDSK